MDEVAKVVETLHGIDEGGQDFRYDFRSNNSALLDKIDYTVSVPGFADSCSEGFEKLKGLEVWLRESLDSIEESRTG